MPQIPPVNVQAMPAAAQDKALRQAAEKLEAGFLAEMLTAAGMGKTSTAFGGGAGEEQFSSFLVQEHAMKIVKAGGIGLAESIFNSLKEKTGDQTKQQ